MGNKKNILERGKIGEIVIRGKNVTKGYLNNPKANNDSFEEGWFRTGDIGRMDEKGFVFIEDRKKDMIIVSGFNVFPNEIEGVVANMEGILETAAIGIPSEKSGEAIKLFVVWNNESITEEDIINYCRKNLTPYKIPKKIVFKQELPKTNVGKILRRALRDSWI